MQGPNRAGATFVLRSLLLGSVLIRGCLLGPLLLGSSLIKELLLGLGPINKTTHISSLGFLLLGGVSARVRVPLFATHSLVLFSRSGSIPSDIGAQQTGGNKSGGEKRDRRKQTKTCSNQ